ncbi:MAG: hypothetical protein C5B51_14830 [Terriglobia bacterium]|nr:MAG: hypothetical protein C5B51_14830 [Terriglobia bacterium]
MPPQPLNELPVAAARRHAVEERLIIQAPDEINDGHRDLRRRQDLYQRLQRSRRQFQPVRIRQDIQKKV